MHYDEVSGTQEWLRPRTGAPASIALAIILDMIADNLSVEIETLQEQNEGLDCTALWYIQEQLETYSQWARGSDA